MMDGSDTPSSSAEEPQRYLVQLLIPLEPLGQGSEKRDFLKSLGQELTDRFGGVTSYLRAPAVGLWKDEANRTERDEIVVYEVMVDDLDREFWRGVRERLETRLEQEELVVRALPFRKL
jgi:hypothetical protein